MYLLLQAWRGLRRSLRLQLADEGWGVLVAALVHGWGCQGGLLAHWLPACKPHVTDFCECLPACCKYCVCQHQVCVTLLASKLHMAALQLKAQHDPFDSRLSQPSVLS